MRGPDTIDATCKADMTLWAFCLYCAHAALFDPHHLRSKVKGGDDRLETVAARFKCNLCKRRSVLLVPTPRTMISFDKMGLGRS
jgi:transposase-like protein